jgi:hypothetical protein
VLNVNKRIVSRIVERTRIETKARWYGIDLTKLPRRPYCTNNLTERLEIQSQEKALTYRYVQLNPPKIIGFIVFHVPKYGAAPEESKLPPATISVSNPENGYCHHIYALSSPVSTGSYSHDKPIKYLNAIHEAYLDRLNADTCYGGIVCPNPLHEDWDIKYSGINYDLGTLASYALKKRIAAKKNRFNTLWESLRHWSYREVKHYWERDEMDWHNAVRDEAERRNCFVDAAPLPMEQIRLLAYSVSDWTWNTLEPITPEYIKASHSSQRQRERAVKQWENLSATPEYISEIQTARINKRWEKESKQDEGIKLINAGLNNTDIAKLLGVSRMTVCRWRSK